MSKWDTSFHFPEQTNNGPIIRIKSNHKQQLAYAGYKASNTCINRKEKVKGKEWIKHCSSTLHWSMLCPSRLWCTGRSFLGHISANCEGINTAKYFWKPKIQISKVNANQSMKGRIYEHNKQGNVQGSLIWKKKQIYTSQCNFRADRQHLIWQRKMNRQQTPTENQIVGFRKEMIVSEAEKWAPPAHHHHHKACKPWPSFLWHPTNSSLGLSTRSSNTGTSGTALQPAHWFLQVLHL